MNQEELKQHVCNAIHSTWPTFQAEHPALSRVIDQSMLGEFVVDALADDPAFRNAYEQAIAARVGAEAWSALLSRFVESALARLS